MAGVKLPLFELHDTHGFPLALGMDECRRRGIKPDLLSFLTDATAAGWTWDKIVSVLRDAIWPEPVEPLIKSLWDEAFVMQLGGK